MSGPLPISIVVPTYERNDVLRITLPSLLAQGVSEILLVNDGGREDPADVVASLVPSDARVRVLDLGSNRGSPAARNAGAEAASSPWVLFSDDDVVLGDLYAATLLRDARASEADLAAGRRLWLRRGETPQQALHREPRRVEARHLVDRRHVAYDDEAAFERDLVLPLIGAVMLVRRELACEVRYEEELYRRTGWREETDFQLRALRSGARALACPHAVCFHLPKPSVGRRGGQRAGQVLRYEWHLFRNNVRFLRRHLATLRDELGFSPGRTPVLGALRAYFGFRVRSKIRHMLGGDGP
ncbi:MAG: glycosyltransferase [Planctomycetota bacterium]